MTAGVVAVPGARGARRGSIKRIAVRGRAKVRARRRSNGRAAGLLVVIVLLMIVASIGAFHDRITHLIDVVQPVVERHEVLGAFVFTGLAVLSSVLIFVSSVLLIPVGVAVWGKLTCFLLLWIGWLLGGLMAYSISHRWGRPAVRRMVSREKIRRYERRIPGDVPFMSALLIQLTVPSDIGGYFFGLLSFPKKKYLLALAIAEIPYAFGTVYLSSAFVEKNTIVLGAAAAAALGLAVWEWRRGARKSKPAAN